MAQDEVEQIYKVGPHLASFLWPPLQWLHVTSWLSLLPYALFMSCLYGMCLAYIGTSNAASCPCCLLGVVLFQGRHEYSWSNLHQCFHSSVTLSVQTRSPCAKKTPQCWQSSATAGLRQHMVCPSHVGARFVCRPANLYSVIHDWQHCEPCRHASNLG